jgi:hypothetical protein
VRCINISNTFILRLYVKDETWTMSTLSTSRDCMYCTYCSHFLGQ